MSTKKAAIQKKPEDTNLVALNPESAIANWDDYSQPEIEGWYRPEDNINAWVIGTIVGFAMLEGAEGPYEIAALRLAVTCKAMFEQEPVILNPGHILAVAQRFNLTRMFACEVGSRVAFRAIDRKNIGRGRSVWKFNVKLDPRHSEPRKTLAQPSTTKQLPASVDQDDLPF
jgi:hypothetical protein